MAGMATVLVNTVLGMMSEAVAEGRMGLKMVGADCQFEGGVESAVIEAWMVVNTVVQLAQEHSDLVVRLPLEAGCKVMDL